MATYYVDYINGDNGNGGTSWVDALKTLNYVSLSDNDVVKIAKSPAPYSIGSALWTNLSKSIVLSVAQNLNIDMCNGLWDSDAGVASVYATRQKEGTGSLKVICDGTPNALQSHHAIGNIDFSSYQKISFWLRNNATINDADTILVCLCSDVAGTVIVDSFLVPAIPSVHRWVPLTLSRVGGGNLGSNIQSIAIYIGGTGYSDTVLFDDFIACTTDGLNLQSLVSKSSLEQGGNECWYGIQSINSDTILIDNDTNFDAAYGKGYFGLTETIETYARETIKVDMQNDAGNTAQQIQSGGTSFPGSVDYKFGYNIVSGLQDGETIYDGLNGLGFGVYITAGYLSCRYLACVRYSFGIFCASIQGVYLLAFATDCNVGVALEDIQSLSLEHIRANNNDTGGISFTYCFTVIAEYIICDGCNGYGILSNILENGYFKLTYLNLCEVQAIHLSASINNTFVFIDMQNCGSRGMTISNSYNNKVRSANTSGTPIGVTCSSSSNNIINKLLYDTTGIDITGFTQGGNERVYCEGYNQVLNNDWVFTDGAIASKQNSIVQTPGYAWDIEILEPSRHIQYPFALKVAEIAVAGTALVTVKVYIKKGHATDVAAKFVCRGSQLSGIPNDVIAIKADDTDWEQLTLTFTPTETGVLELECWAYWVNDVAHVYIDTLEITQDAVVM